MLDHGLYASPGHLVRRLQQVSVSLFAQRMEAAGVDLTSVQYAALKAIQSHPMIDQATLAGAIAYDRTTIGGVIDRLESKGLVRRELSPSDRRVRQLVLEAAGERLIGHLQTYVQDVQVALLAPLSEDERQSFMRLLQKLTRENNEHSRAPLRPVSRRDAPAPGRGTKGRGRSSAGSGTPVEAIPSATLAPGLVEGAVPLIEKQQARGRGPARQHVKRA